MQKIDLEIALIAYHRNDRGDEVKALRDALAG